MRYLISDILSDIPRYWTALAEWAACLVLIVIYPKRWGKLTTAFFAAAAHMALTAFLVSTKNAPKAAWIPCMLAAFAMMYLFLALCLKQSARVKFGAACKAFLVAEFAASLGWQIVSFCSLDRLLSILIMLAGYFLVFFFMGLFERYEKRVAYDFEPGKWQMLLTGLITAGVFAFSNFSFVVQSTPFSPATTMDTFMMRTIVDLAGIFALYMYLGQLRDNEKEKELIRIEAALKNQYEQYRIYNESNMDIRIKYHDMKHQIEALRLEDDPVKRKEWLDGLERELDDDHISFHTGCSVLDTVLTGKALFARRNGIQMTVVADGDLLKNISVRDLCTIFGNALDNAFEAVMQLPEPEMRLIHLTVSERRSGIFILIENYCSSGRSFSGGLPSTTKKDKKEHGLGLKSIDYTVARYGGSMTASAEDHWFHLRIYIPIS